MRFDLAHLPDDAATLQTLVRVIRHVRPRFACRACESIHQATMPSLPIERGRLWVYVRDDRPWAEASPPAAAFFYSPGRKGERPAGHLAGFRGFLQADTYTGFDKLYGERIIEVACWSHARRKVFEVHESTQSPVAAEALAKIAALYRIETTVRGRPPDQRRAVRQEQSKPLLASLHGWLTAQLNRLPPKSGLAQAFRSVLGN
ncbi:MAG: transposase [Defluviicoccus sp.]|nr:MAG: transposase [Defluviicoccus sp.]